MTEAQHRAILQDAFGAPSATRPSADAWGSPFKYSLLNPFILVPVLALLGGAAWLRARRKNREK